MVFEGMQEILMRGFGFRFLEYSYFSFVLYQQGVEKTEGGFDVFLSLMKFYIDDWKVQVEIYINVVKCRLMSITMNCTPIPIIINYKFILKTAKGTHKYSIKVTQCRICF